MKVCLISGNFPPKMGGIATFSWDLAYYLSRRPEIEKVSVLAFGAYTQHRDTIDPALDIFYFPDRSILQKGYELFRMMRRLKQCDLFQAITLFPEGVWETLWGKLVFRRPCVITLHGTGALSPKGSRKTKLAKHYALHHADRLITVSRSTDEKTRQKYRLEEERTTVIPYATLPNDQITQDQVDALRTQYGLRPDDFVVLTVCRLIEGKGVGDVLRAFQGINDPKIKFLVAGDGPDRERFQALADQLQVSRNVIWAGRVPHDTIPVFYKASNLFVLASFFQDGQGHIEGLPIALLEAQSYGLPVVVTESFGNPETLEHERSGFVVPERRSDLLQERIVRLASDPGLYQQFSAHARRRATTLFSWEQCVTAHLNVYRSIL